MISPAIFGGQAGFEKAGADGVQRGELFAIGEQGAAAFDFAAHRHQIIESIQVLIVQAHGHAQLAQVAVGAGDFDGLWIHGNIS
jgi:hypothetical protein